MNRGYTAIIHKLRLAVTEREGAFSVLSGTLGRRVPRGLCNQCGCLLDTANTKKLCWLGRMRECEGLVVDEANVGALIEDACRALCGGQ